ncbi:MAG: hypothetical protein WKF89_17570 [Chitinophagaceae bacterium]
MKKLYLMFLLPFTLAACSTLTKTQINAVNQFAQTSKGFSAYPSKIMESLAQIRSKRGIYFANSLDNPALHIQELDSIYSFKKQDYVISRKIDITFKVIDKYAQSLLLLSSDKFEKDLDIQALHFGEDLDSLTVRYNSITNVQKVPVAIGAAISQLVAFGGRQYIRARQAKEIKKFVPQADTLIAVMSNNLLDFLLSSNIQELIKNEEKGVNNNYLSYLRHVKTVSSLVSGGDTSLLAFNTKSTIENDNEYMDLKTQLDGVKKLRQLTIDATRRLRKAHTKLLDAIARKRNLKTTIWEVQQLYDGIKEIKSAIELIEKPAINAYGRLKDSNT